MQFSDPLSPSCLTVLFSPRAFRAVDHTLRLTHTCGAPLPRPVAGQDLNLPAPRSAPLSSHPHSTWAHAGTTEQLTGPTGGREGAVLGSDGQSGCPIESGTASPKGGRGGSDGPNEQGARVGLPPGIPLARIVGLWVTRKLGGRWRRRPGLGGRVSDTGPSSRKRSQGSRHPAIHPRRRPRAEARAGARVPLLGTQPLLLVATESRGGSRCERRGVAGAGLRAPPGAAEPKSGEEEKRQAASGDGTRTARSEVCGGPPPGPGHSRRVSLAKVWRRLPRRRRWLRAPRRAGAERAPLPLQPGFCVSRLLFMRRPATSRGGPC